MRLYHFSSDADNRRIIVQDVRIVKLLYDMLPGQTCIKLKDVISLAYKASLNYEAILRSIGRIVNLYQLHIPPSLKMYFPQNMFGICSKIFTSDDDVRLALEPIPSTTNLES